MTALNKKKLPISLIIFGIFSTHCSYGFDLVGAWHAADEYDAAFSAARHERNSGEEKAIQGRAQLLPQISANANYYRQNIVEPNIKKYETSGWNINLTQPIFDVEKYAAYHQGQISTKVAETKFSISQQNIILDTAKAYFAVLLAYDTLSSTRSAKEAYAKELEQAKVSFHIGTSTIVDTDEAQAHYDAAVAKEISAQTDLRVSAGVLEQLTGLNPKQIQLVDGKNVLNFQKPLPLTDWQKAALTNSLDVKNAEYALDLAKQDLLAKQGNNWPKVNLSANYSDNRNTSYPMNSSFLSNNMQRHTRNAYVGVEINLPIFSGGGINSQITESAEKELEAKDNLEATKRQVKEDIRRTYLDVSSGIAQIKAIEQLLKSTKSTLESTRLGKEVGVRSNLDLLKAEQNYYETTRSLAESRYKYLLSRLSLAQASGMLNSATLTEVNKAISPIEIDQKKTELPVKQ